MVEDQEIFENRDEDTLRNRFLTFQIDRETYGIEIRYVMEIVGIQLITEMPEMPEYIRGIINLRGKIIPVMDVRLRFGKAPQDYNDRTCVIVIDFKNMLIGLIVDSVSEVLTIPEADISERPNLGFEGSRGYINLIGKIDSHVVLLIDCGKLLSTQEYEGVSIAL